MNKIKVVSFYVARLLDFMVIGLPVYIIFQWIFIHANSWLLYSQSYIHTHQEIITLDQVAWTPLTRFVGCCAQLIEFGPFLGILYFLAKVFHRYELGEIFTMKNAQYYYQIGILLFLDALLAQPISGGLWVLSATLSNPVGQRYINISIGTPNIMAVLMGLLVILISWVMIEGSKIQNEQQLII
jgi:hypothetical protein